MCQIKIKLASDVKLRCLFRSLLNFLNSEMLYCNYKDGMMNALHSLLVYLDLCLGEIEQIPFFSFFVNAKFFILSLCSGIQKQISSSSTVLKFVALTFIRISLAYMEFKRIYEVHYLRFQSSLTSLVICYSHFQTNFRVDY